MTAGNTMRKGAFFILTLAGGATAAKGVFDVVVGGVSTVYQAFPSTPAANERFVSDVRETIRGFVEGTVGSIGGGIGLVGLLGTIVIELARKEVKNMGLS